METLVETRIIQETNAEGYLKDFNSWTPDWAKEIAVNNKIELTPKHWELINWLRKKEEEKVALSIRKIGVSGIVDIKQFYQLFPGAPLKLASKIAGIKKPVSCI